VDKQNLREEYTEINTDLLRIRDKLIYNRTLDEYVLREQLTNHKLRLDVLKIKQDDLIDSNKDHRPSIMYHICKFFKSCFCFKPE